MPGFFMFLRKKCFKLVPDGWNYLLNFGLTARLYGASALPVRKEAPFSQADELYSYVGTRGVEPPK